MLVVGVSLTDGAALQAKVDYVGKKLAGNKGDARQIMILTAAPIRSWIFILPSNEY